MILLLLGPLIHNAPEPEKEEASKEAGDCKEAYGGETNHAQKEGSQCISILYQKKKKKPFLHEYCTGVVLNCIYFCDLFFFFITKIQFHFIVRNINVI
jgi:hypothetical protein